MPRRAVTALLGLVMVGCGSAVRTSTTHLAATMASIPQGHPQVVEPVAGAAARATVPDRPAVPNIPTSDPPPTGPATITDAPAKGAPTDAEVRAAIARFQAAVARYHLDKLDYSHVVLNPADLPPGRFYVSIASVYTDYGKPIACGGLLKVPELGVANKTLPCGTEVTFVYGGRAIRVPVIDRGPYIAGREWDLTGATAEALRFPGLGPIQWRLG